MHIALCCFANTVYVCVCVCILVWHTKTTQHCGIGLQEITQRNHNQLRSARADTHSRTSRSWIRTVSVAQLLLPVGVAQGPHTAHWPRSTWLHLSHTICVVFNSKTHPYTSVPIYPSTPPILCPSFGLSLALFSRERAVAFIFEIANI